MGPLIQDLQSEQSVRLSPVHMCFVVLVLIELPATESSMVKVTTFLIVMNE